MGCLLPLTQNVGGLEYGIWSLLHGMVTRDFRPLVFHQTSPPITLCITYWNSFAYQTDSWLQGHRWVWHCCVYHTADKSEIKLQKYQRIGEIFVLKYILYSTYIHKYIHHAGLPGKKKTRVNNLWWQVFDKHIFNVMMALGFFVFLLNIHIRLMILFNSQYFL
jgi:hypothetical protein